MVARVDSGLGCDGPPALCEPAGPAVHLESVSQRMHLFLTCLAMIHLRLFNLPLVVQFVGSRAGTAAFDPREGVWVRLRATDKDREQQLVMVVVLGYLCKVYRLAFRDERETEFGVCFRVEEV